MVMVINDKDLKQIVELVVTQTINILEERNLIKPNTNEKSAYSKTESLLYNYNNFKRIIKEREKEIEELRTYGVPTSCAVKEYVDKGNSVQGIVLDEERVEAAVATVQESIDGTANVIALIDKCMGALKSDPYYDILEMRYFEGRTQEDIAIEMKCSQVTISKNKSRLVKELAMRIFPNQCIREMME